MDESSQPEGLNQNTGSPIWQYATYLFATLWLLTLVAWLSRKSAPAPATKPTEPRLEPQHFRSLKTDDPSQLQQALLHIWNQKHQQAVTNLGQIRQQLDDDALQQALYDLQQQLYGQGSTGGQHDWSQLIKSGRFAPANKVDQSSVGLPGLYD